MAALSQSKIELFFFLLLLVQVPFKLVLCQYVGVGESEDVQLFCYFVKADTNPEKAPIMTWISGGPGCSAFSGLIYENGPISFELKKYNGSLGLSTLVSNPNSWTKVMSLLYIDYPVRTGYSYARTEIAAWTTDVQEFNHTYEFLRKWLMDHPELISNPVCLGGDSYAGIPVPVVAQLIHDGNEAGVEPFINLKGYVLGNGKTYADDIANYRVPFAYSKGLIPRELYQSLQRSCGGDYTEHQKRINAQCSLYLDAFHECVKDINCAHILEPYCGEVWPHADKVSGIRRSLSGELKRIDTPQSIIPFFECLLEYYALSEHWMNH